MKVPWKLALRDAAILALALALWAWDARVRGEGGALAIAVALSAGVLTALVGYLLHEWGHLAGAALSRSVVHLPAGIASVFLFRFDSDRNTRAQFLAMSWGGFVASGVVLAVLAASLPLDALSGRTALLLAGLGVAATLALEVPPAWRVARGAPIPTGVAYASSERP